MKLEQMISVTHYIAPRQTGKTTKSFNIFGVLPAVGSYYIKTMGTKQYQTLINCFPRSNILFSTTITDLNSKNLINVVVDEYLISVSDKSEFIHSISYNLTPQTNIFLFSTPDKIYTQEEIDTNEYLFLKTQQTRRFNTEVVQINNTNAHLYGFSENNIKNNIKYYSSFASHDIMKKELFGLYKEDQELPSLLSLGYIPKPKSFKPCHIK